MFTGHITKDQAVTSMLVEEGQILEIAEQIL
jgi:hypothetical protein